MNGIELIAKERQRQIEKEGYTPEHDKQYANKELYKAGCCYLANRETRNIQCLKDYDDSNPPELWPWDAKYWKPSPDDRIRELVKAGALFKAQFDLDGSESVLLGLCIREIEELQRLEDQL